jgi:hypothetical protein
MVRRPGHYSIIRDQRVIRPSLLGGAADYHVGHGLSSDATIGRATSTGDALGAHTARDQ